MHTHTGNTARVTQWYKCEKLNLATEYIPRIGFIQGWFYTYVELTIYLIEKNIKLFHGKEQNLEIVEPSS